MLNCKLTDVFKTKLRKRAIIFQFIYFLNFAKAPKTNFSCRKILLYIYLCVGIFFCGFFCTAILFVSFTLPFNFVPLFGSQFLRLFMFVSFLFYITFFVVRSVLEGNMSLAWYVILQYMYFQAELSDIQETPFPCLHRLTSFL